MSSSSFLPRPRAASRWVLTLALALGLVISMPFAAQALFFVRQYSGARWNPEAPSAPLRRTWNKAQTQGSGDVSAPTWINVSAGYDLAEDAVAVATRDSVIVSGADGSRIASLPRSGGPITPPLAIGSIIVFSQNLKAPSDEPTPTPSSGAPSGPTKVRYRAEVVAYQLSSSAEPQLIWRHPVERPVRADMSAGGLHGLLRSVVFVATERGEIEALDATSGESIWSRDVGGFVAAPLTSAGTRLYVTTLKTTKSDSAVIAIEAITGKKIWKKTFGAVMLSAVSVAPNGSILFADSCLPVAECPHPGKAALVRRYADDGGLEWSANANNIILPGAPPVLIEDQEVVAVMDRVGQISMFDAVDGTKKWDFAVNRLTLASSLVSTSDQLIVASDDGYLTAVDTKSGHQVWESKVSSGLVRTPLLTTDAIFVSTAKPSRTFLAAFVHDPDGTLADVVSPTEVQPAMLLLNFAVVALPLLLLLVWGSRRVLAGRGSLVPETGEFTAIDPWEAGVYDDDDDDDDGMGPR